MLHLYIYFILYVCLLTNWHHKWAMQFSLNTLAAVVGTSTVYLLCYLDKRTGPLAWHGHGSYADRPGP